MFQAFTYYLSCHLKNLALYRLRRLRQPKYLLSAFVGAVYVLFLVFQGSFSRRPSRTVGALPLTGEAASVIEFAFALVLFLAVVLPWILPISGRGLLFTEAEIQFLFPAPMSRRSLLRYRLARSQPAIVFGVLISLLVFGRGRSGWGALFLGLTLWLVYTFLSTYRIGVDLARSSLEEHGFSGLKRQMWTLGLLLGLVGSVIIWLRWFLPSPPALEEIGLQSVLDWLMKLADEGPAYYIFWPFRTLVRPALARDLSDFSIRLLPAAGLVALLFTWVIRREVSFEEAALERSETVARRLDSLRKGVSGIRPRRNGESLRPPFELTSEGLPLVAIFWKNLIAIGRINPRRLVPIAVVLTILVGVPIMRRPPDSLIPQLVGNLAYIFAIFMALVGPVLVRDDLRTDLLKLDLIKTYPVPGWSVVAGEVMGPACVIAIVQWILLGIAAVVLPGFTEAPLSVTERVSFGLTAAILLPCISLLGLLVQNGTALLMPGWVQLGKERQRGVEAIGQRLISTVATIVFLAFAILPAILAFAFVSLAGYWFLGKLVFPIAAAVSALALLIESAIAVFWLGRMFENFDASIELPQSA